MATYCFRCRDCGQRTASDSREVGSLPAAAEHAWARDYRSENVGVAVQQLKNEREHGGTKGYDSLFLPTNKDFAGPGDPDGTKGMRQWRDEHQPKAGNKNPRWPGEVEKRTF